MSLTRVTSDLVTCISPLAAFVERTLEARQQDYYSVKDFGAKGNGSEDDTAALQAAIDSGLPIDIPAGEYLITAPLVKASGALIIRGAGRELTKLLWAGTGGSMIKHTPQSGDEIFDISDFTVIPQVVPESLVFAIEIDSTAQMTTETYKGMYVVGEREKRRGSIRRIDVKSGSSTLGFYGFLRATSTLNWSLTDFVFIGASSTYATEAIAVDGDGAVVDIHIQNGWIYNAENALFCPDYVEAIYFHDVESVNVHYGARIGRYVSGRSVLSSDLVGSNSVKLGPLHINAQICAVDAYKGDYFTVDRLLCVLNTENSPSQLTGVQFDGCQYPALRDSVMQVTGSGTVPNNAIFGSVVNASPGTTVRGVLTSGVYFNTYVLNASVSSTFDDLRAVGTDAVGLQFADAAALACNVGRVYGDSSAIVNAPSSARRQLRTYSVHTTVTVSGGVATVAVPASQFDSAPTFGAIEFLGTATAVGHYNYSASSATSAVFNVTGTDGTYEISLFVSE